MALAAAKKATSKAATAAARAASRAARNPLVGVFGNLAPDELASPSVQRQLARMGFVPGAQGMTGYANGGPLANGIGGMTQIVPGSTGGIASEAVAPQFVRSTAAANLAPVTNVAQSASQAAAAQAGGITSAELAELGGITTGKPITPPTSAGTNASKTGRMAGLLSWNPSATRAAAAANPALTGAELSAAGRAGGWRASGSLGRAGLYGMGGYLGANLLHGIVGEKDGTWDDAAEGALKGAGVGAGIGSMILPGIGTGIGAGLGAIGGGLWGAVTGDDSPGKQRDDYLRSQLDPSDDKSLLSLMGKYGLSMDAQHQLLMQLEIVGPTLGSKDEAKALVQQVMGSLPQLIEEDKAQQAQASRVAAMQAYLLPMMQQSQQQTEQFMQQQATLMNDSASRMSPSVANIYRQHAADLVGSNTRAYQAQLTQMLLAPQLYQQQSQYGTANPAAGAVMPAGYSPVG